MSEITTGAVPLSVIGAPLAVGAVCFGAAYFAGKYCAQQYDKMLAEIEDTNVKLKWLNNQMITSPKQMIQEAMELQKMVAQNNLFGQMTEGMGINEKQILSGVIATQNSPLKSYVPRFLEEMPKTESIFEKALGAGAKQLAVDNLNFVNQIIKDAAKANGFTVEEKILKQNNQMRDIVFVDEKDRRFTAYCKLDKDMNPSLALDLEGFACDDKECSLKMEEIVKYLQEHGVPFHYQRLKHNQPLGVLRRMLNKKTKTAERNPIEEYLQTGQNSLTNSTKH